MVKSMATCLGLLLLLRAAPLHAQDAAAFDRPGIGFASTTVPRGSLAWEQGLADVATNHDANGRQRQWVADTLLRYGLRDGLELQLGADSYAWQHVSDAGGHWRAQGMGNSRLGLKASLPGRTDAFSWAMLATASLPTGRAPIGGGTRGYDLGITAQWAMANDRSFALYADRSFGPEHGWMLSPSYNFNLSQHWASYLEAGIGSGSQQGRMLGSGLTWQPNPRFQLDVSALRGVRGAADWHAGLGVSLLIQ